MSQEYERELTIEELNTLMGKNVGKKLTIDQKKRILAEMTDNTGKVYRFPMLSRECPNYKATRHYTEGRGLTMRALQDKEGFCREGRDACKGTGYTISDRVEDWLEAGRSMGYIAIQGFEGAIDDFPDKGWLACVAWGLSFVEISLIDAIAESMYAAVKEEKL